MMEEKRKNLKDSVIKALMIAVATLLFMSGEAGAQTACANLANVQAWDGRISISYIYTGSNTVIDSTTVVNKQDSADASLRFANPFPPGSNSDVSGMGGNGTATVSINERETISSSSGPPLVTTYQASGQITVVPTLVIFLTTCEYAFDLKDGIEGVITSSGGSGPLASSVSVSSGMHPIAGTNSILSGTASFPFKQPALLGVYDYYLGGNIDPLPGTDPGSATVTWEFTPSGASPPKPEDNPCIQGGSIIECQNQILGEAIDIVGTPFSLNYRSDRVPGHMPLFWNLGTQDAGGWSLNVHHAYDPVNKVILMGDGSRRSGENLNSVISNTNGETIIPSEDGSEVYIFSSAGRHLRTLDALTGVVRYQFAYDSAGRLTAVTDADGNNVTIERNAAGGATAIVPPYGQRTTLTLDGNGYLANITDPAGESVRLVYSANGLLTSLTDHGGNIHRFSYDSVGRVLRDDDPLGGSKTLERTDNISGYSVRIATDMNRTTTYQVERFSGGEEKRTNTLPTGIQTLALISANGSETDTYPDGTRITLVNGPDPRFGMLAPVFNQTITTPGGLSQTIVNSGTATLVNPYDTLSLKALNEATNINGRIYTSNFDATSMKITSRSPEGRETITTLDNKSHIIETHINGLLPVQYTYDSRGRLITVSQGTRIYSFNYDVQGNLAGIMDPLSHTISYEYDLAGRVTKQTFPDGREVSYSYDPNSNIVSITPPGRPAHAFTYNKADLIKDYMPPGVGSGMNATHYDYNIDHQVTQVERPDGTALSFDYDSSGRLSTIIYPQGKVMMAYDTATGNSKTITAPDGGKITYAYDGSLLTDTNWSGSTNSNDSNGNSKIEWNLQGVMDYFIKAINQLMMYFRGTVSTHPSSSSSSLISGSVHRTYDNNFRITSESVNGGNIVNYQYDQDGLLTQAGLLTLSNDPQNGMLKGSVLGGITDMLSYNNFGEVEKYQAVKNGTNMLSVQYIRDNLGRIVQKNETIEGATHTYAYMYDQAGRLTNVSKDGVMVSQYVYDANGNRLSYTGAGGTISGTYDNQDRLVQYGTTSYTYTANGELLSKTTGVQTTNYKYDALGNLMSVTLPDGTKIEYIIDGQNRRIGKKVNGVLVQGFLYRDGLRPVAELDGAGNVVSRFVYAGSNNVPDYMIRSGVTYRIISDYIGSPRLVVDGATGTVAQRMDYDEFGNITADTNPGFQPFGFAGGVYDRGTRLIRFGARDYDAELGRWTAKDPILFGGGDTNLYRYVLNNPMNIKDSDGLNLQISWPLKNILGPLFWPKELKQLEEALKLLDKPGCACALRSGNGYEQAPWDSRDIDIQFDPTLELFGSSGLSNPLDGIIYLNPNNMDKYRFAQTIAHEAGHFRDPYLGHETNPERFKAEEICGSFATGADEEYFKNKCQCG
jgi:RHS repeat-associated protein